MEDGGCWDLQQGKYNAMGKNRLTWEETVAWPLRVGRVRVINFKRGKPRYEGRTHHLRGQSPKRTPIPAPLPPHGIQFLLEHFLWQETQLIKAKEALIVRKHFILFHSRLSTHGSPSYPLEPWRTSLIPLLYDSSSNIWRQLSSYLPPPGQNLLLSLIFLHMTQFPVSLHPGPSPWACR